ncbi:MAG: phage baseplate assembly protein V [Deltaproteobacteria bacterium]|jgi:uncharacterized protein involved in type VI secretion and phage assembly|nr:phage baseplate assembly protein V [Deltaproteobacteria bacterium]
MSDTQTALAFGLDSVPELTFHVLAVSGTARLNGLYRFGIRALALSRDLDSAGPQDLLDGAATLSLRGPGQPGEDSPGGCPARAGDWHGVVTAVSLGRGIGDFAVVDLALEPSMSRLRGQIQSRIHMDATSPEIVLDSMAFGGMDPDGARLDLLDPGAYPRREFVMQHGEDLLRFVMRTLEREGITLRFDQSGGTDVAVLTDSCARFPSLTDGSSEAELGVTGVSGLGTADAPALYGARLASRIARRTVRLRDYDWMRPGQPVEAELEISADGRGEIYLYGENFTSEEEGRRLAAVIRDAELWDRESLSGMTHLAGVMPGLTLGVRGSRGGASDGRWAVRSVSVTGSQAGRAAAELGLDFGTLSGLSGMPAGGGMPGTAGMAGPEGMTGMPGTAGPAGTPVGGGRRAPGELRGTSSGGGASRARGAPAVAADGLAVRVAMGRAERACSPLRLTPRPPAAAPVPAWIDGSGTAGEPEMDEFGRYRVLFPFDLSGRASGKASPWIRLARPGAGSGYGQHFPLTPGCEVQVAFTDGDPDRPVITGAVADAATGSLSGAATPFVSGIGTRGGGGLLFGEKPDGQSVTFSGGSGRGSLTISAGSPTTAEVVADVVSQLSASHGTLSFFGSTGTAGSLFSVRAQSDWVRGMVMTMTALREAAGAASEWTAFERDRDKSKDATRDKAKADALTKASDAAAWASYLAGPLQHVIQWIYEANERKNAPPPDWRGACDEGIFTLRGGPKGAMSVWRTTEPFTEATFAAFFAIMKTLRQAPQMAAEIMEGDEKAKKDEEENAAQKPELDQEAARLEGLATVAETAAATAAVASTAADTAAKSYANDEKKQDAAKEAKKTLEKALRAAARARERAAAAWRKAEKASPKTATAKASNRAVRIGSVAAQALTDTIVSAKLLMTLAGLTQERARGLHVVNTDSYVAVTAETHASFSAKGPLFLESGGDAPLGEDLRYPHVRGDARLAALLAGEDGSEPPGWDEASAVLLRGQLVRTLAGTLSLGGTRVAAVKSPLMIRVATGENRAVPEPEGLYDVSDVERECLLELDRGPGEFVRGVSLEVLQDDGVARMCCLEPSGAVQLLQGSHRDGKAAKGRGADGERRLELSSDGARLQDGKFRSLTLSEESGASLKNTDNAVLVLKGGKASLKSSGGLFGDTTLDLGENSLKVGAQFDVKIEGAGSKIVVGVSGVVATSSSGLVDIQSKLLKS